MKRIVLMYDGASSAYAGAEMFFINAATELSKHGFEVTLVDLPDSLIPKHLKDHGVPFEFVPFKKGRKIKINGRQDYLMVTNTKIFHCCRLSLNWDCKVLVVEIDKDFWEDGYENDTMFHKLSNLTMRRWRQYLISNKGLAILENSARELAEQKGYAECQSLPKIPLMVPDVPSLSKVRESPKDINRLRFLGAGRDARYKIAPLAYFFPRIKQLLPEASFKFVTHNVAHAETVFREMGVDFVQLIPSMEPERLNEFMDKEADCVIAMGTTSLNAALLGLPTLIGDASKEWPYPATKMRWIHDCNENIGEYVTSSSRPDYGIDEQKAVCDLTSSYSDMSRLSKEYVEKEHSARLFVETAQRALAESRVTFFKYVLHTRCGVLR